CNVSEQVKDVEPFKFVPCQIRVTTKPDQDGDMRNSVARILHINAPEKRPKQSAKPAQSRRPSSPATAAPTMSTDSATTTPKAAQPTPAQQSKTANSSGGNGSVPPWRQAKPSLSEDLNDSIPD